MTNNQAIFLAYPNVAYIVGDKAFDLQNNEVQIDQSLVQAKIDSVAYAEKRSAEYPSFADQFDTLFHGGYDAWKAQIQAVKDKYPKE